jgi:hypothetical protein
MDLVLSVEIPDAEKLAERGPHIRESWVKAMEARIVREELVKCQRGEGVNHYKKCGYLAEMYTGMIRDNKVSFRVFFKTSGDGDGDGCWCCLRLMGCLIGQGVQDNRYRVIALPSRICKNQPTQPIRYRLFCCTSTWIWVLFDRHFIKSFMIILLLRDVTMKATVLGLVVCDGKPRPTT